MDKNVAFDVGSASLDEAARFLTEQGAETYRAAQICGWIRQRYAEDFTDMANIPKKLREKLSESAFFAVANIARKKTDNDGTIKYLLELKNNNIIVEDGVFVESVLMSYRHGTALCLSTQAGCAMGCVFCASGRGGLLRDLTAGEMLAQVCAVSRDTGKVPSNITLMGCGEPLHNYDNVVRFIRLLCAPGESGMGLGVSQRRVTLSTCGLTDRIHELMSERLQVTLAVSLHAPNDAIRRRFMPVAARYPMDGLLAACAQYAKKTGRRVTYEYAMIAGQNDAAEHARELAAKLRRTLCHINLIPVNPAGGIGIKASGSAAIAVFKDILADNGIAVTVRRSLGGGVNAACGQLVAARKQAAALTGNEAGHVGGHSGEVAERTQSAHD